MNNGGKNRREVLSWCLYDWGNSAFATVVISAVLPVYYNEVAGSVLGGNKAIVYWGYTVSVALLITALLAPVMGAVSDFMGIKKRLLMLFAAVGVFATSLLYFIKTGDWFVASMLFVVGHVGFSMSEVFYNAILPDIAAPGEIDRVSTKGYALGYLGGGIVLALNLAMIRLMEDKGLAVRLSFVTVAVWWAVFTIPLILNIKEPRLSVKSSAINPFTEGFKRIYKTAREITRHRDLVLFLVAFWIYNDGIGTIIKMATIYGSEIGIDQTTLIGALLMTQFVGIPFSLLFGRLAGVIGTKNSIMLGLVVYTLISVGGYYMETATHFWILAFLVGTVQGGTQALSRSLFSRMLPRERTAEFYGFYGTSSKFAGIVGPLVFAIVADQTGNSRLSIVSLIVFFVVGAVILSRVNIERGENTAGN